MNGPTTPTRQLILLAAIDCIEEYGLEQTTTRRIAERAGTNVASINYYFRTKEDLIAEALVATVQHMLEDVMATIDEPDRPLAALIEDVFFYLMEGSLRWPGITTAHLYRTLVQKEYDSPAGRAIRLAYTRLQQRAAREYPEDDPEELNLGLAQALSAIMLTVLAPGFLPMADRYRPADAERCRALAGRLTEMLYAAWGRVMTC